MIHTTATSYYCLLLALPRSQVVISQPHVQHKRVFSSCQGVGTRLRSCTFAPSSHLLYCLRNDCGQNFQLTLFGLNYYFNFDFLSFWTDL